MSNLEIILCIAGVALLCIPLVLLLFGEIGPSWWKKLMHRYQEWHFREASPLMPFDPYKPASEALSEDPNHFPPFRQRVKNAAFEGSVAVLIGLFLFALIMLLGQFGH